MATANIPRANGSGPAECAGDSAGSVVLSQAERLGTGFRSLVAKRRFSPEVARKAIMNVRGGNSGMPCSHRNLMQVRYDVSDGV